MASGVIPKEELAAYTRWQAEEFFAPARQDAGRALEEPALPEAGEVEISHVDVHHADFALPTAADIEKIHEEARQHGFEEGLAAGHAEGYKDGYEAGQAVGKAEGRVAGEEEGRRAGYQEGFEAGTASAHVYAENICRLADGLQRAIPALDQAVAESLLACALEIAAQVLKTTVRVKPETLLPIIREALAALPLHHGAVTLFVSNTDAAFIREQLGNQFSQEGWVIQEDDALSPGDCHLKAGASEVDARLDSRWRRALEGIGLSPEWLERQP